MNKKKSLYIIVGLVASLLFYFTNENLRGYLRYDAHLSKEIHTHKDSLYQNKIASKAPFKYRVLFPTIVKSTHKLFFDQYDSVGFYYSYKFWSWFFYVGSACLLFRLMRLALFDDWLCLTGAFIFVLLPPMLMAYTLPVHTREDPLAYTILFLGLISLLKDEKILFVLIAIAGALCRETLLLLPMLYFFFADDKNLLRRFIIPAIPCLVWLSLRVLMQRQEYDVLHGFHWNNNNVEQVFGFLFITFNVLWISFVVHLVNYREQLQSSNKVRQFFYRSSLLTLIVILLTTYFGGIYNEIRLLYLLAPWMILIGLDFIEQHGASIKTMMMTKGYITFIVISIVFCLVIMYFTFKYQNQLLKPGKYAVPYHLWIIIAIIYINITIVFAPASLKVFFSKRIKNV